MNRAQAFGFLGPGRCGSEAICKESAEAENRMPYQLFKGLLSTPAARSTSRRRCRQARGYERGAAATAPTPDFALAASAVEALESRTLLSTAPPQIGINLDAITYYSSAWTFTDAFKQSAPFTATAVDTTTSQSGKWGQGGDVSVNSGGWPTELKTWADPATGHTMRQRLDTLIFRDIG